MNNTQLTFLIAVLLFTLVGLIFHPVFTLSLIVLVLLGVIYHLLRAFAGMFRR